jgi:hypothetical protein
MAMMTGTDYVVTQPFFSSNGMNGIIDFFPGDHLLALGQSHDPGWQRALLSRGSLRKPIVSSSKFVKLKK